MHDVKIMIAVPSEWPQRTQRKKVVPCRPYFDIATPRQPQRATELFSLGANLNPIAIG